MTQFASFSGSVTVLNGHIHQIVQKVEGNMTFHTARSTSLSTTPSRASGSGPGPPAKVPAEQLPAIAWVDQRLSRETSKLDWR